MCWFVVDTDRLVSDGLCGDLCAFVVVMFVVVQSCACVHVYALICC